MSLRKLTVDGLQMILKFITLSQALSTFRMTLMLLRGGVMQVYQTTDLGVLMNKQLSFNTLVFRSPKHMLISRMYGLSGAQVETMCFLHTMSVVFEGRMLVFLPVRCVEG